MTFALTRSASRAIAAASTVFAIIFGSLFLVIRSDFMNRDCHSIPSVDWKYTANCVDAFGAMRFTGVIAFICLLALCCSVWRMRRV